MQMSFDLFLLSLHCSKISFNTVSKAQHGCIDCLALMICAELQSPASSKDPTSLKNNDIVRKSGDHGLCLLYILDYTVC